MARRRDEIMADDSVYEQPITGGGDLDGIIGELIGGTPGLERGPTADADNWWMSGEFPKDGPPPPGFVPSTPTLGPGGLERGDPGEGSREHLRDIRPPSQTPTTFAPVEPPPMAQPQEAPPALPQGVTVDDSDQMVGIGDTLFSSGPSIGGDGGIFSGVPDSGNTMDVPGPSSPDPSAFAPQPTRDNLSFPPPESGRSAGPRRRSAQPSVLYGQSSSPTLSGRAGGLMDGGLGSTGGSDAMGPLRPSELMQRLLQMFARG